MTFELSLPPESIGEYHYKETHSKCPQGPFRQREQARVWRREKVPVAHCGKGNTAEIDRVPERERFGRLGRQDTINRPIEEAIEQHEDDCRPNDAKRAQPETR